jgi:hypothetical protein
MAEKKLLSFKDMYVAEYRPGEDELINYRAKRRKNGAMYEEKTVCPKCNGKGCDHCNGSGYHNDDEKTEALTLQQRLARKRLMRRFKGKIKIGRDRAKRRMASKEKLEKRALKQAKTTILKKLTKGIPKSELTYARRQEIEKRLEKPQVKNRIKLLSKRLYKDVRKKEVERKKG